MVDSKQQWKAWLYLAPAIVLLLVFTGWPIINTVRMAFLDGYNGMEAVRGMSFSLGIDNFVKVISYKGFLDCLKNTMLLCVLTVPISTILALLIAVCLNSIKPFQKTLQTIFFLPYVTNSIAIGMVFAAMFNIVGNALGTPNEIVVTAGIINNVLEFLHDLPLFQYIESVLRDWLASLVETRAEYMQYLLEDIMHTSAYGKGVDELIRDIFMAQEVSFMQELWLRVLNVLIAIVDALIIELPINWINAGSSYWANITVMTVYIVWNALPFKILVLLGGLQSINKQYYDAAKVDGTPRRRVFTKITVPLLSPMLAYVIITGFIGGFKEYSSIVGIFGVNMGPADDAGRLNTMVGYIYDALPGQKYGRASAAALILFAIIFVVTMINMQVSKKRVHY